MVVLERVLVFVVVLWCCGVVPATYQSYSPILLWVADEGDVSLLRTALSWATACAGTAVAAAATRRHMDTKSCTQRAQNKLHTHK